ncbi:MAG TPA: hypothetical protein VMS60_11670 [Solirubrobacterales bacterium]|nr:hypothetical protein [Solirubrobacterales bacterium]
MASLFGLGEGDEDLAMIRALRSDPPGRAGDGKRGKTFGAALEQFEQLLRAGREALPATAPLSLFYALTQAGRAILAAHAPQPWEVHGHGLKIGIQGEEIGGTTISPSGEGLFQAVAAVTGSDPLTEPMTLAETWARIPHLARGVDLAPDAPVIFAIDKAGPRERLVSDESGSLLTNSEDFTSRQSAYPELGDAEVPVEKQGKYEIVGLAFTSEDGAAAFDASLWTYLDQPYLRVSRGRGHEPSGLMLWWMLLQALSHFARYEPARWTAALAPDGSTLAVPLEDALQRAAVLLPRLVREALVPAN